LHRAPGAWRWAKKKKKWKMLGMVRGGGGGGLKGVKDCEVAVLTEKAPN